VVWRALARPACVHPLEMSPFLPFRDVTVGGFGRRSGAKPVRSAAPDRRPPLGSLKPHLLVYRARISAIGSWRISADFKQPSIALIAAARRRATARLGPFDLLLADKGEGGTEPLVLDNRRLRDLAQGVKGAVSQFRALVAKRTDSRPSG